MFIGGDYLFPATTLLISASSCFNYFLSLADIFWYAVLTFLFFYTLYRP